MNAHELRQRVWQEVTVLTALARTEVDTGEWRLQVVERLVSYAEEHLAWQPMDLPAVEALITRVGQLQHIGAGWGMSSWVKTAEGYLLTVDDYRYPPNDMGYYNTLTFSSPAMWQRWYADHGSEPSWEYEPEEEEHNGGV